MSVTVSVLQPNSPEPNPTKPESKKITQPTNIDWVKETKEKQNKENQAEVISKEENQAKESLKYKNKPLKCCDYYTI